MVASISLGISTLPWLFPFLTFSLNEVKHGPGNTGKSWCPLYSELSCFPVVFTANSTSNFQVAILYVWTHNVLFSNMPAVLKGYAMIQLNKHLLSIYFSLTCCTSTETVGTHGAYSLSLRNSIYEVHREANNEIKMQVYYVLCYK